MYYIEHTISDDLITWDHENGICKLIRVPRDEIDEGSQEPDAWDLLWIEASGNVRRFEARLDDAYGRGSDVDRDAVRKYALTAPDKAAEILSRWS